MGLLHSVLEMCVAVASSFISLVNDTGKGALSVSGSSHLAFPRRVDKVAIQVSNALHKLC